MSSSQSNLSASNYGYDVVVATTQATINSQLKAYLKNASQPVTYAAFLAGKDGKPTVQTDLDDLLKKTGGVNPFEIPAGTPADDQKIAALDKAGFLVGVKARMGMPPGVAPTDLPPVITLGTSAARTGVNLFCSELAVVQNKPAAGESAAEWNVWTQPSGAPWYFSTEVDLTYKDLSKELDTPYFRSHPKAKAALLAKLKSLGSMAYSLQQLVVDFDTTTLESLPKIEGLPADSDAARVLQSYFIDIYARMAAAQGDPVLAVQAVGNAPDKSGLVLTGLEREVTPPLDASGKVIAHPSPVQQETATLDYLGAVNENALPPAAPFTWAWVDQDQVDSVSGAIAINRNLVAQQLIDELVPMVRINCLKPHTHVSAYAMGKVHYTVHLKSGQAPNSAKVTASGAKTGKISHSATSHAYNKAGATAGELKADPSYDCTISVKGNQIVIEQHMKVYFYIRWDDTSKGANLIDKCITDTYAIGVDAQGGLTLQKLHTKHKDDSQSGDLNWFSNTFGHINNVTDEVKKSLKNYTSTNLKSIEAAKIQNFVFPGAAVFTFGDAAFSDHQDLVANITYVPAT